MQEPAKCVIAASACISNYYDSSIDYDYVNDVVKKHYKSAWRGGGLGSPEIGCLLNTLGFHEVTIISTDLEVFDYSLTNASKSKLAEELRKNSKKSSYIYRTLAASFADFLEFDGYKNDVIIDNHFGNYIRYFISNQIPLFVTFNWTLQFNFSKSKGIKKNPIFCDPEYHIVVVYGYDDRGVFIIDSHEESYKYKLKKFRKGRYILPWEELMISMAKGDIIVPTSFKGK